MRVTIFVIAFLIFMLGLWLMGHAFEVKSYHAFYFLGGILVVSLSMAVPAHILRHTD